MSKPEGYTISALSEKFGVDRRTLKKYLANVKPTGSDGKSAFYRLEDVETVLKQMQADAGEGADLKAQKLMEEIRKLRLRNDATESKLVERAAVADSIRRIYGAMRQQLEQQLCNEYPTRVAGMEAAQARVYGKATFDLVMAAHLALEKEWA